MSRSFRILLGTVATGVALTGLVAFAHTPWGQPVLSWLADAAGCPIALDHADPSKVEAFRRERLAARDGTVAARTPVAGQFTLGTNRRAEVAHELRQHGYACTDARGGSAITCDAGPESAHLQFDAQQRLVAVDWMTEHASAAHALRELVTLRDELRTRVGPETRSFGTPSTAHVTPERLRRTAFEYRYAGYVAKLSVTNIGGERGYLLRQQFQWLPPDA
ncbi:MAG TPA: hypothetical protein VI197_30740 [Polyangiaceae bacterium]